MARAGKSAFLFALAAALLGGGCGSVKRPYAHDPLFRNGDAVWGDHGRTRGRDAAHAAEPAPPEAPNPTQLPTLEWERIAGGLVSPPITSRPAE